MADTTKQHVRNTAKGIRGLHAVNGYIDFAPGETRENVEMNAAELKSAKATGYFVFGKDALAKPEADEPAAPPPATPQRNDELDAMNDGDLKATVQAITGKEPPADADRAALLKLARGED